MSLQPATYEEAKAAFKPLRRSRIEKRADSPSPGRKTSPARRKAPKAKRKKLVPLPKLKKKVWRDFSVYVRSSVADEFGVVQCVTCPNRFVWNSGQIQAGHWIHNRLDFDERNVHPQCVPCNYHWNTKVSISYAIYMTKTYGLEVMEELQLLANTHGNRYSRDELESIWKKYKALNEANSLVKGEL